MSASGAAAPRLVRATFAVGLLQCNCSILADMDTREAMVVDPGGGDDVVRILNWLGQRGLKLTSIVVTHAHLDHVGGAAALRRATGAPVVMHQDDLPLLDIMDQQADLLGLRLPEVVSPDISPMSGSSVQAGQWHMEVLTTPGHTQGSICLYGAKAKLLLAGDTLFAGSIGRTDLPGGNGRQILRSIQDVLLPLPEETRVVPGHGTETTIGREKETNPWLRGM